MGTKRVTISAVLIVKDEEAVLDRCLSSLSWCDQIVVYDTGSTDATRDIAHRHTDVVVEGFWDGDFAAARNRALEHATAEWVLSIDADEVFDSQPSTLRKHLAKGGSDLFAVMVRNEIGDPTKPDVVSNAPRVFRRQGHRYRGKLHEQVCDDSGRLIPARLLSGVWLAHSGYTAQTVLDKDKGNRNVGIVRAELDQALLDGRLEDAASARVHLIRSLGLMGARSEARDLMESAWLPDLLKPLVAAELTELAALDALGSGDFESARRWLDRWAETIPDDPELGLARAEVCAAAGETSECLAWLAAIPQATITARGHRFERVQAADREVRILVACGESGRASRIAADALRHGSRCLWPGELLTLLGVGVLRSLACELSHRQWREWTMRAVADGGGRGLGVLEVMWECRADDAAVLVCAASLSEAMTFEQAGLWSARLRRNGLDQPCPLLARAADPRRSARERALCAALIVGAYDDPRAIPLLEAALAEVPSHEESVLMAELEIVAPGLVAATAGATP